MTDGARRGCCEERTGAFRNRLSGATLDISVKQREVPVEANGRFWRECNGHQHGVVKFGHCHDARREAASFDVICNGAVCKRVGMNTDCTHHNRRKRAVVLTLKRGNSAYGVHAMYDAADNGASGVKMRSLGKSDEELAADTLGADAAGVGEGQHAGGVELETGVDLIR
ncbi:Peptidyl-prolyl cis-trans isomerase [Gracilaria domingensis]|nr:Peptidyl-prolyl cis-trans isomerase [Gracilaria domingensis]